MDPRQDVDVEPTFPADLHKTLLLRVKDGNAINLENLRLRIKYEIKTRKITMAAFADKVLGWKECKLNYYLELKPTYEQCQSGHYQMYDWLILDESDKEAVLNGDPPEKGHFENPYSKKRFPKIPAKREIGKDFDSMNVENVAIRLYHDLRKHNWTHSQFADRVFQGIGTGATVSDMIDNMPPLSYDTSDHYRDIFEFLKMNDEKKKEIMTSETWKRTQPDIPDSSDNGEPTIKRPKMDGRTYHLNYVADPSKFNIKSVEFKDYMKRIVEPELYILDQEIAQKGSCHDLEVLKSSTVTLWQFLTLKLAISQIIRRRLITLAFMTGSNVIHDKLIECIKHVLAAHGKDHKEFAEIVLKCPVETFESYLKKPNDSYQDLFMKICKYLLKSLKDREAAWTSEYRTTHIKFLMDPYNYKIEEDLHFKYCMGNITKRQSEILEQELAEDPSNQHALNLKTTTLKVSNFLENGTEDSLPLRKRIIEMAYMDGSQVVTDKLVNCIERLLKSDSYKKTFVKNFLKRPKIAREDGTLEECMDLEKTNDLEREKMIEWLNMTVRLKALREEAV